MGWAKINVNNELMMIETEDDPEKVTELLLNDLENNPTTDSFESICTLLTCHFQKPIEIFTRNRPPVKYDPSKFEK